MDYRILDRTESGDEYANVIPSQTNKLFKIAACFIAGVLLLGGTGIVLFMLNGGIKAEPADSNAGAVQEEHTDEYGVTSIGKLTRTTDDTGTYFTQTYRNDTGMDLIMASVQVSFYDKNGNYLGEYMDTRKLFEAGDTWEAKIADWTSSYASCKVNFYWQMSEG